MPERRGMMPGEPGMTAEAMPGAMPTQGGGPMPVGGMTTVNPDGMPAMEEDDDEASNVTPEEQAIYHKFMENYYTSVYVNGRQPGPQGEPSLLQQIEDGFANMSDPIDALANTAATIVSNLSDGAEAAGKPIPGDVLMHAGTEVLEDLAELSEKGGFHEFTDDEMESALFRALDVFRELKTAGGGLNMEAINQDYKTLVAADKAGNLDDVLPGATEAAERYKSKFGDQLKAGNEQVPSEEQPEGPPKGMGRRV